MAASAISPWRTVSYNLVTAAVRLVSIAVPPPYRYLLWAVAVLGEIGLLAVLRRLSPSTLSASASSGPRSLRSSPTGRVSPAAPDGGCAAGSDLVRA